VAVNINVFTDLVPVRPATGIQVHRQAKEMLDKKLLSMLVCPVTKAPLIHDKDHDELVCSASGLAYPIRDGIPVMLESEARTISLEEKEKFSR